MNRVTLIVLSILTVGSAAVTNAAAPKKFQVRFETTQGNFVVEVHRDWSPRGADRFHELVTAGFYDNCGFFRVVPGFMVQFGINGDPAIQGKWKEKSIADDPVKESNLPGFVTFAKTARPNSRTTQLFINYGQNAFLDSQGFSPFGKVVSGMEVVKKINSEYGEKPSQAAIQSTGNDYLKKTFPRLDYIKKASLVSAGNK